jgi:MYND finger
VSFASRDAQGQALQSFDQAFASIDSLSASEKKQIVRTEQVRHTTVGALLSRLKDHFVGILKQLDECRICTWGPTGVYMPVAIMAGSHCDCCLKPRGESVFMVCDRCALAHYCSVQCQRKAWKDHGHKMVCRKKGEFRVGDVAGSVDHFGALGFCHPVRLQAPAAGVHVSSNRSSWQVQSTLENDSSGVKLVKVMPVASLVRIRPGLWNILKRDEWEAVRENMNAAGDDDGNVPNLTLL